MKALNFNKDSWHYYIASNLGNLNASRSTDICSYTQAFLIGLAISAATAGIMLFAAGAAFWIVGNTLAWWAYLLTRDGGEILPSTGTELVGTTIAIVGLLWWVGHLLGKRITAMRMEASQRRWAAYKNHEAESYDSFFTTAYKAFKEKTCVRVVLVTTKPESDEDD